MNVLLLSQLFSSTRGGGEYVVSLIAKSLAENGHKVWVITNRISDESYKTQKNVEIVFVPPILKYKAGVPLGFRDNMAYCVNAILKGTRIIKNESIDIIHSNNFAPALTGAILSHFTSKPHIMTIHDVVSLCGQNYWQKIGKENNMSRVGIALAPFFEKLMVKFKYACIHTVSETSKDDLLKIGAKKLIYVIQNAIENTNVASDQKTNPFQLIYVGRLVFYKNLEIIIKALSIAKKQNPKIKLIVVGVGPHLQAFLKLANDLGVQANIEFKCYVDAQEKNRLVASSAALVFPSLCEGFGLVILEAFAQNKPVLVSDIKPMSDIVQHNVSGFVINPHDEKLWANYFDRIINNPQEAERMGRNGNEILQTHYNKDVMYQKIMKMYADVLKTYVRY